MVFANLRGADLCRADLRGAELEGADLREADLSRANLSKMDLSGLDLGGAKLAGAYLSEADLRGASLDGADFRKASLSRADLTNSHFDRADLREVDLTLARLVNAQLDGAILTAAKLWDTQRTNWSLRGVICEHVYWDRDGIEATHYAPGEFERLHSEQPRIELFYQGGISSFEVNTLPALLHRLQSEHPGSRVRLQSLEQTGGGVKVVICVEDAEPEQIAKIKAEAKETKALLSAMRNDLAVERGIKEYLGGIVSKALASSGGQHVHIAGPATGVVIAGGKTAVHANIAANDLPCVTALVDEILRRRDQLALTQEQEAQLEKATETVKRELDKKEPQNFILSAGLKMIQEVAVKTLRIGDHYHDRLRARVGNHLIGRFCRCAPSRSARRAHRNAGGAQITTVISRRMCTAASMRRSDHPSHPSAITCCFFSSRKTLVTLTEGDFGILPKAEGIPHVGINVLD